MVFTAAATATATAIAILCEVVRHGALLSTMTVMLDYAAPVFTGRKVAHHGVNLRAGVPTHATQLVGRRESECSAATHLVR